MSTRYHADHPLGRHVIGFERGRPIIALGCHVLAHLDHGCSVRAFDEGSTADAHAHQVSWIQIHVFGVAAALVVLRVHEPGMHLLLRVYADQHAVDVRVDGLAVLVEPVQGPEGDDVELHVGDDSGQCGFALLAGLYGRVSESGIVQAGTRIAVQFPELAFLLQVRVEAGFIQRVGGAAVVVVYHEPAIIGVLVAHGGHQSVSGCKTVQLRLRVHNEGIACRLWFAIVMTQDAAQNGTQSIHQYRRMAVSHNQYPAT